MGVHAAKTRNLTTLHDHKYDKIIEGWSKYSDLPLISSRKSRTTDWSSDFRFTETSRGTSKLPFYFRRGSVATPMRKYLKFMNLSATRRAGFKIPIIFKINNQICISSIGPVIRLFRPRLRKFNWKPHPTGIKRLRIYSFECTTILSTENQ